MIKSYTKDFFYLKRIKLSLAEKEIKNAVNIYSKKFLETRIIKRDCIYFDKPNNCTNHQEKVNCKDCKDYINSI